MTSYGLRSFDGYLDEITFYDYPLSAYQLEQYFDSSKYNYQ